MRPTQTPKWLGLFIKSFGAKGLVALAWWLGALHAERIRALQGSYPLLEITGGAGSGKSVLTRVLWKLIGSETSQSISARNGLSPALLREFDGAADWPVVLEESREAKPFDWDVLKECYRGEILRVRSGKAAEQLKFQGALVVISAPPVSFDLNSRTVVVRLDRTQHTPKARVALEELLALPLQEHCELLTTGGRTDAFPDQVFATATESFIKAQQEAEGETLDARNALNHAQLRALLVMLDALFGLPIKSKQAAHEEVRRMTFEPCVPY